MCWHISCSDCGYDHTVDGVKTWKNIYNYTGCLAHAEIIMIISTGKILRIWGHFEHNQACQEATIAQMPELPIHPSVYIVALAQLCDGSSITDVQTKISNCFGHMHTRISPFQKILQTLIIIGSSSKQISGCCTKNTTDFLVSVLKKHHTLTLIIGSILSLPSTIPHYLMLYFTTLHIQPKRNISRCA